MIKIRIADLTVGIDNRFDYIVELAHDYLTEGDADFTVSVTDAELDEERAQSEYAFSRGYLESIVAYRKIAEELPRYDAFVFHGAVLNLDGEAYAFTAPSGTGKTTHTRLWLREFGSRVHYLNGDKPIIRFKDGIPYAYGTPWRGKEGYGVNESAPLRAIAFLGRGEVNTAAEIPSTEIATRLITQIYVSRKNPMQAVLTMRLADRLTRTVRLIDLRCNMEPDAAHVSLRAMRGTPD